MKRIRMTIKAADIKVSTGHKQHASGSGYHSNQPKRKRTRQAQRATWSKEW
jgi:hypothetical protein